VSGPQQKSTKNQDEIGNDYVKLVSIGLNFILFLVLIMLALNKVTEFKLIPPDYLSAVLPKIEFYTDEKIAMKILTKKNYIVARDKEAFIRDYSTIFDRSDIQSIFIKNNDIEAFLVEKPDTKQLDVKNIGDPLNKDKICLLIPTANEEECWNWYKLSVGIDKKLNENQILNGYKRNEVQQELCQLAKDGYEIVKNTNGIHKFRRRNKVASVYYEGRRGCEDYKDLTENLIPLLEQKNCNRDIIGKTQHNMEKRAVYLTLISKRNSYDFTGVNKDKLVESWNETLMSTEKALHKDLQEAVETVENSNLWNKNSIKNEWTKLFQTLKKKYDEQDVTPL